ncbi:MAG: NDP-sugar synthase [Thermoleophilia bacterium]
MQAVILVGGEGTRLRPLTATRPKPMMPLVDRPFVAHQLDHLRRFGVTDIVFSCGYRPDALEAHFGDGAGIGVKLRYVVDPMPLGTAGAVVNALELLGTDDVLVLNGDVLTDLDLAAMIEGHRTSGARATIALTPVEDPSAYGLVRLREDRSVLEFVEKPGPDQLIPGEPFRINAGTYLLSREVVASIPTGRACSIEREIFPAVAEQGGLFGHPSDAYWRDIGTPSSYLDAHRDVLAGRVRTDSPTGDAYLGAGTLVAPGAVVGGGASLGAGCVVEEGAVVEGAVVGDGAHVAAGARLAGCVLGCGVRVGAGASLTGLVVVGDDADISPGARLDGPVSVDVGARVPSGMEAPA